MLDPESSGDKRQGTEAGLSQACERVGRFLYEFAKMEKALDAAIAKLFDLSERNAAILVANIDFSRKVKIVRSAATDQWLEHDDADLSAIEELFKKVRGINDPHRVMIAHSSFEPDAGGVRFLRNTADKTLIKSEKLWQDVDFEKHYKSMEECSEKLIELTQRLEPTDPTDSIGKISNAELRKRTSRIAKKMRNLESIYRSESSLDMPFEGMDPGDSNAQDLMEDYTQRSLKRSNWRMDVWSETLRPEAIMVLQELGNRLNIGPMSPDDEQKLFPVLFGMIAGYDPLGEAATVLDRWARSLPQ